jgi:pimeloyl-ACP methyl ester carboxylesterase
MVVFPPGNGKIPQFCDENGEVIENSLAEKCYLDVEDGKLGMVIMAKDMNRPILLVCGGGPGIPEYLTENMYPSGLADQFVVCYFDYRGTGVSYSSDIKAEEMTTEKYISDVVAVSTYLKERFGQEKIYIMGHSFGGRVAIRYSANNPIEKLVLFGSPCIRHEKKLPLSTRILKGIKKLPGMDKIGEYAKNFIGSRDYKAASPVMRQTLVNVVNEDLSNFARDIEEPTLLIWGEYDTEAPVEDARELEGIMVDAALIVLPGSHYAYIENLGQVVNILNNFI